MSYKKLQPGDEAYEIVIAHQKLGLSVCDAADHNEGCSNPECFNYRKRPVVKGPINGNIFAVLGASVRELPRAKADELRDRVFHAPSYSDALNIIQEYVEFEL